MGCGIGEEEGGAEGFGGEREVAGGDEVTAMEAAVGVVGVGGGRKREECIGAEV